MMSPLTAQRKFASHLVCTTVALDTNRWMVKFVDEVGSTVLNRIFKVGSKWTITKADRSVNSIIFHCRMSTIQKA